MAIEVDTSKDIREYKINNIGPFNNRQIVCIGLSLIYSVPLAAMMPVSTENKVLFGLIIAFPVAACGFIKLDGCYFEVLLLRLLYVYILTPSRRKVKLKNPYKEQIRAIKADEEDRELARLSKRQRKRYEKNKKTVRYSKEYKVYR